MQSPTVEVVPEPSDRERVELAILQVPRDATRSALAGGIAGVLVLGIGGRLVMRLATLLDPRSVGSFTENGNMIGAITLDGTLALILFGGLLFGLIAAIVWVAVGPWIPGTGLRRATLAAPTAVALSGFMLVESDNPDFRLLANDGLVIAMLLGLIAVFGFVLALLDEWLDRRLPPVSRASRRIALGYSALVVLGALAVLPLAVGFYFSRDVCGCEPQVPVALAILVAGGATVAWWVARAGGPSHPPKSLKVLGGVAVLAGVVFGTLRVAEEVGRILAAS